MAILQFLIISAICMVLIKFVASWFGYGNIPILNKLVTIILSVFVTFEIVQLVQAIIVKFG
ncbi:MULTISPECIES: hypothetical protein [Moorena]|uniref:Uncharacterized protein n=2 Tax=Moorena TaxID=1155738 RepID=A0A1D8TKF2_9CYAN|nr:MULTISPECIES: hypothetical protein [Moorena]NEO45730.1 hypothetical protein [Moorena sp. SIO4A3]NEQ88737.1 hypothetical protein [Moorena sp. SIO2I5]OLT57694.1 hypothetical protein BJP37_00150 [Moorena bouillonii PNG]AOW98066.1 hypothetical protein BJP34_00200 [Moorena producens PAL-8-15-08-1]NEO16506.1 hypothetical protein [Moorena sp. SIO3E8]